jgi:hypothetical protein
MADDETTAARVARVAQVPGVSDSDFSEAAANPSSFSVEGLTQSNRSLSELIALDKYLRKRNRAACHRNPLAGIGIAQVVPPGP